jgi:His-Xaa-Ser system protein HxsD
MSEVSNNPLVSTDLSKGSVVLEVDAALYPLEALYGASYVFIDRAFVFLEKPSPNRFKVTLSPKKPGADAAALQAMVGEFSNELLSCAWRAQITQANRAQIEAVTLRAVAGAMGPPSLSELANFDFTDAPLEDPLGIAMSWEEKYKKKDKKPEGASGPAPAGKDGG